MRKLLILLVATTLIFGVASPVYSEFGFGGAGAGFQIGPVFAKKWNSALPAVAFGFGAQGIVEINLDKIGKMQYIPSLTLWFRSDKGAEYDYWSDGDHYYWDSYKLKDGMVAVNIFDLKYLPPLPESVPVRPYIGFGPTIIVHTWGYEYVHNDNGTLGDLGYTDKDNGSDADAGFNLFCGLDFKVNDILEPFVEGRFVANDKDLFKLSAGLNFRF